MLFDSYFFLSFIRNKSDHKKKGKGKEQEVVKDKKRRSVDGSENIDGVEVSKKNKKERDVKLNHEEQKRPESKKQEKIDKNQKTNKKEKTIVKVDKEVGKKPKRSIESDEQPEDTVTDRSANKEESRSKTASKSKSVKKSKKEGDATDGSINDEPPMSDVNSESSETEEKNVGENKRVKKVKQYTKNDETVKTKKSEKVQTSDQRNGESGNSKYLNDTPEKSYYLNEDGLIKEKQSGSGKRDKKHKHPRKSSEFVQACRKEAGEEYFPEKNAQPHELDNCKVEAECSPDKNIENFEKSKYFADDTSRSNTEDSQLDETEEFETEEESIEK